MRSKTSHCKKDDFSRRMRLGINTLYYLSVLLLIVFSLYALYQSSFAMALNALLVFIGLGVTAVAIFATALICAYLVGTIVDILKKLYSNRRKNK